MKIEHLSGLITDFFIRYILTVLLVLGPFWLIYALFTPATIFVLSLILKPFYSITVSGNFILVNGKVFELIEACIAGSAYFLLVALNLTTREISLVKRIYILLFSFASFFVLNILRLFILINLFFKSPMYFTIYHKFTWYALSIVIVACLWFLCVKLFKIKKIPVISDIIFIKNIK